MNLDSLLNGMNATLAGAIFGLSTALTKVVKNDAHAAAIERFMPVVPLILGAIGGAIGAVEVDPVTKANQIVAGLMVGGITMIGFKIGKTTVMGKGLRKKAKPVDPAQNVEKTGE